MGAGWRARRLPNLRKEFVDEGGLVLRADLSDLFRRAAFYVDILKGEIGRFAGAAGNDIRVLDQLESSEAGRHDDFTERIS